MTELPVMLPLEVHLTTWAERCSEILRTENPQEDWKVEKKRTTAHRPTEQRLGGGMETKGLGWDLMSPQVTCHKHGNPLLSSRGTGTICPWEAEPPGEVWPVCADSHSISINKSLPLSKGKKRIEKCVSYCFKLWIIWVWQCETSPVEQADIDN